jgi:AraC family transcriptional regulator
MHAWEAIQKTLDYIEDHIGEDISIEELAKLAALSQFYYQRLFSRLVNEPVREYIKLRRLARAVEVLQNKQKRIIDIALDYGFGSHETFTRAFKETYGITPDQYRKDPVCLNNFIKPELIHNYVIIDEGVPLITDGMVLEMSRKTLSKPAYFMGFNGFVSIEGQLPAGEATGIDEPGEIWKRFHQNKNKIPRIPGGRELGAAFMGNAPEGCFTYFAGAEVKDGIACEGFSIWELPAREYVVCGFEAENFQELTTAALDKALKYSNLWLNKHNVTANMFVPELYYDSSSESTYMELWMPVKTT